MKSGDIGHQRRIVEIPEPERLPDDQPVPHEEPAPVEQPEHPVKVPA